MDSDVHDISFDEKGHCNYCEDFLSIMAHTIESDPNKRRVELERFVEQVKKDGKGKKYDCIIGLSGGVDSAWVLYQAKKKGLRPLAVHMDNGWNSELAQSNIEGLVRTLEVDLITHVINWEEYRKLMQAFFDADVIDIELLYDNAMIAVNYKLARKYKLKWILAGNNTSTEGMKIPSEWNWFKYDARNIRNIASRNNIKKLETFPVFGVKNYIANFILFNIKWTPFLDFFDYKKEEAIKILSKECGFKSYPYKHYESIFTRFYQGYLLPKKFSVDKRKLHLSTLVASNQMERVDALSKLEQIPYPSLEDLDADKEYFLKKMRWTDKMLIEYLSRPKIDHEKYGSEVRIWKKLVYIYKKLKLVHKTI